MDDIFQSVRQDKIAEYNRLIPKISIGIEDEHGQTLLHLALIQENNVVCLDLIARGIDVNRQGKNGQTPLHLAAEFHNYEIAEAIINAGGNPNIKDTYGNSPLYTAVYNAGGIYKIVELFMNAKADSSSKNNSDYSPLDFALQRNEEALIALLS